MLSGVPTEDGSSVVEATVLSKSSHGVEKTVTTFIRL